MLVLRGGLVLRLVLLVLRELLLRLVLLVLLPTPLLRRGRGRAGSGSRPGRRLEGSASRASAHPRGGRHPHHASPALASAPAGDDAGGRAELAGGRRRRLDASGPRVRNADAGMTPTEGDGDDDGVGTPGGG